MAITIGKDLFAGRPPWESRDGRLSIHSGQSIAFMKTLNPPELLVSILEDGYKLPIRMPIPDYYEPNNKSALENIDVLRAKVFKWEAAGYCHRVSSRPPVCSPMSVSEKMDLSSGELKKRPCLDASRHLNKFLKFDKVKLSDLSVSEKLLDYGDWQSCFDLENQYFHVSINPAFHKYLGFSIPDVTSGDPIYFCFSVLIYGISPATWLVTFLTKPLMQLVNTRGIRCSIMIDDGRTLGKSSAEALENHQFVLAIFQQGGWNVQWSKTSTEPVQALYHQGFVTDTRSMTYSIPDFKVQDIQKRIGELSTQSSLRELAQVVGKLSSVERAVGPVVRVMLRSSHQVIAQAVEEYGEEAWDFIIEINEAVFRDLNFLKTNLVDYNGQPIINSQTGFCLNSAVDNKLVRPLLDSEDFLGIWAGDASDCQAVGYDVLDPLNVHVEYFTYSQKEMSSGARELIVIESTLENCVKPNQSVSHGLIYWLTDSKCLVAWLERGSRINSISDRIVALYRKLHGMKLKLVPMWIPRSDYIIALADSVSKFKDTDDWGLSAKSFKILQELSATKFTVDTFANCTNKKCPKFYSKVPSPGSSGVNCFMFDWSNEYVYCCPPVKLVTDVVRHIIAVPCMGVLIVPNWKRDKFWPFVTWDGAHLRSLFTSFRRFKPTIMTGKWSGSYFKNNTRSEMLALYFDTTRDVMVDNQTSPERCLLEDCRKCQ